MIPIICISILTVLCLFFIWIAYRETEEKEHAQLFRDFYRQWYEQIVSEAHKWRPQRDSKGRFIKESHAE